MGKTTRKIKNVFRKLNPFSNHKSHDDVRHELESIDRNAPQPINNHLVHHQDPEEIYQEGKSLFPREIAKALHCFEEAADLNHAMALHMLGKIYEKGLAGIKKDNEKALSFYQRSAKLKNPLAQYKLGKFKQYGFGTMQKDEIEAVTWYQQVLENENKTVQNKANYKLGEFYHYGLGGFNKNPQLAEQKYQAAAQEYGKAAYQLAVLYLKGQEGFPKNHNAAKEWYLKAINLNHHYGVNAAYELGLLYQYGAHDFAENPEEAKKYYKIAADNNSVLAQSCLAEILLIEDTDIGKNVKASFEYFWKAANNANYNECYAKSILGFLYQMGWIPSREISPDKFNQEAVKWHTQANTSFSYVCLALMKAESSSLDNFDEKAVKNYLETARQISDLAKNPNKDDRRRLLYIYSDVINWLEKLIPVLNADQSELSRIARVNICTLLGMLFENGFTRVNYDAYKASNYYRMAADLNGIYARKRLEVLQHPSDNTSHESMLAQAQIAYLGKKLQAVEDQLSRVMETQEIYHSDQIICQHSVQALELVNITNEKRRVAEELFAKSPNLDLFYRSIRIKLEDVFTSFKAVNGGQVNPVGGQINKISGVLEFIIDVIAAVPITAPAGIIGKYLINKPLEALDHERQINIAEQVSMLATKAEADNYAESFARLLTMRYQQQLEEIVCTPEEEAKQLATLFNRAERIVKNVKDKVSQKVVRNLPATSIKKMVAFIILWTITKLIEVSNREDLNRLELDTYLMREFAKLENDEIESIWQDLVKYMSKSIDKLKLQEHHNELLTKRGLFLQTKDLLTKPGIRTECGNFYKCADDSAKALDWMLGSNWEAHQKRLEQVIDSPNNSIQVPPIANPAKNAMSLFNNKAHRPEIAVTTAKSVDKDSKEVVKEIIDQANKNSHGI